MVNDKLMLPLESDIQRVLMLEIKEIPSFSTVMTKLLEICSDEDAAIADLSRLMETNPEISAKIIGIANSSLYGLKQIISTVSEAVILLGFEDVRKIALGSTVFEKMFKSENKK